MRLSKHNQLGFTLVEILIVMAIVGLLASVITTAVAQARSKGRDAKRKSDLVQMQKALEIYYNTNNSYPHTCATTPCALASARWYGVAANGTTGFKSLTGATAYIPNLAPTFISKLPVDPSGNTTLSSGYMYKSDGINYKLVDSATGPESFPSASTDYFYDSCGPTTSWRVTNNPSVTSVCANW